MKSFKSIQKDLVEKAIKAGATCGQLTKAKEAKTLDELISVGKDNFAWLWSNKVIDTKFLKSIGGKKCAKIDIYFTGTIGELKDKKGIILCGDVIVNKVINSQVDELWENSKVGELWGNSQVGVLWENSKVGVLWENSKVGVLWENSQVGVLWENSKVGVLRENSKVGVLRENSKVGELRGNSQVGEQYDKSIVRNFSDQEKSITFIGNEYCFIDYYRKEIFIGKSFKINQ